MIKSEFHILFEKLYNPLCNYANAIIQDYDQSEDIVQEIFVNLWNKRDTLDVDPDKIENYLIRSVKFKCIDLKRKEGTVRKHEKEVLHTADLHEDTEESEVPNYQEILYQAIAKLPEKTRAVFVFSKMDGLSYNEIADRMGISPKTVENQMGRAFKHLRTILKNEKLYIIILFLILGRG